MIVMTAFFARKKKYNNLLTVFKKSLKKTMPNVSFKLLKMDMPENVDHKRDAAFAFIAAAEYALKHQSGLLAVADTDLMFLKSIESVRRFKFDIAITTRKSNLKYNTGLWFMRPTARAKEFIERWIFETNILINNFCEYENFCWEYGGIDQASLYLTLQKDRKASVLELPCQEWNATQSEWKNINKKTRVVHFKSQLRGICCGKDITEKNLYLLPLVKKWRSFLK